MRAGGHVRTTTFVFLSSPAEYMAEFLQTVPVESRHKEVAQLAPWVHGMLGGY